MKDEPKHQRGLIDAAGAAIWLEVCALFTAGAVVGYFVLAYVDRVRWW